MSGPFRQVIVHIDDPRTVENVAGWQKGFRHRWRKTEIKERRESKPHATAFISDRRPAQTAAHLAGENPFIAVFFAVLEFQAVRTFGYSDIVLVKNRCPLHRGPM